MRSTSPFRLPQAEMQMKKVLALLNPARWIEGFMLSKFLQKVVTGVVASVVGLAITPKVAELLTQYGVNLDAEKLKGAVVTAVVGLVLGALNTAKNGPLKPEE